MESRCRRETLTGIILDRRGETYSIGVGLEYWQNTRTALQLGGNGSLNATSSQGAGGHFDIAQNAYINSGGSWAYINTDEASVYNQVGGTHNFKVKASGTADTAIAWTNGLTVDNSANTKVHGRLGVGGDPSTADEPLLINGTGGDATPLLKLTGSASDGFNWISSAVHTNLAVDEVSAHFFGKEQADKNLGWIGFKYKGDHSVNNLVTIGFHSANHLFNVAASGNCGIGTETPKALLDISSSSTGDYPLIIRSDIDGVDRYTGIKFGYNNGNTNHQKAAIQVRGTSGHVQPDMHFMLNTAPSEASVADADADRVFTLRNAGTQDHWGNRIVNSQTVNDLHRTAEPSLRFDGSTTTDPMVTVTAPNFPTGAAPRTMAGWVKIEDVTRDTPIFGYGDGANSSGVADTFEFYHYQSNSTSAGIRIHNAVSNSGGTTPITPNVWMHIAATYDGTTLKVYYDGVLNHSQTVTLATVSSVARFGADSYSPTPGAFFKGEIKDVCIHNRALDADEIAALYNGEATPHRYGNSNNTNLLSGTDTTCDGASDWAQNDATLAEGVSYNGRTAHTITSTAAGSYVAYIAAANLAATGETTSRNWNITLDVYIPSGNSTWKGVQFHNSINHNGNTWTPTATNTWQTITHTVTEGTAGDINQYILRLYAVDANGATASGTTGDVIGIDNIKFYRAGEVAAYTPQSINDNGGTTQPATPTTGLLLGRLRLMTQLQTTLE